MIKHNNRIKLKQLKLLNPKAIKKLGEEFCDLLFFNHMTSNQFQALSSIGFMIFLDMIYDNESKDLITTRLKELHENK